mgnify:CR=1 FL=1
MRSRRPRQTALGVCGTLRGLKAKPVLDLFEVRDHIRCAALHHHECAGLEGQIDGGLHVHTAIETRNQKVWIPVTVAALVPGVLLMGIPFLDALTLFSSS